MERLAEAALSRGLCGWAGSIKVFFYDAWAEALSFILNQKHRLVLTGPGTMVRRNEAAEVRPPDEPCQ